MCSHKVLSTGIPGEEFTFFFRLINAYRTSVPTEFMFSGKVFQKTLFLEEAEIDYTEPF